MFLEYLYDKIRMLDPDCHYLDKMSGERAANSVFRNFISFQYHLLSGPSGKWEVLRALEVDTYKDIQQALNGRG